VLSLPGGAATLQRELDPGCRGPLPITADPERARWIVRCDDERVLLVDPAAREQVRELARTRTSPALFLPGTDEFVVATHAGELLHFADSAAAPTSIAYYRQPFSQLVALPSAGEFVAGTEDLVEHLDRGGRKLGALLGHRLQVMSLAASADGRRILSAGRDNVLRLYDGRTHELLLDLAVPELIEHRSMLSPDGTRVAVAVASGDVLVWDVGVRPDDATRRREHRRLRGQEPLAWLGFEPDGRGLLTITTGGRITRWRDPLPDDPEGLRRWIAGRVDPVGRPGATIGCARPE
jgi:WD40 repeat protein